MGMMTMRIEIELVDDIDFKEFQRFMDALSHFADHWKYVYKEIRIVREPKQ